LLENTFVPTVAHTVQTQQQLHFGFLEHRPYNSDIALSSYDLLGPLKGTLRSHRFASARELKWKAYTELASKPKPFFCEGTQNLTQCRTKYVENQRDYIEK